MQRGGGLETVLYFDGRPVGTVLESSHGAQYGFVTVDHLGTPVLATAAPGAATWIEDSILLVAIGMGAQASGEHLRPPGQWSDPAYSASVPVRRIVHSLVFTSDSGRYISMDPHLAVTFLTMRTLWDHLSTTFDPLGLLPGQLYQTKNSASSAACIRKRVPGKGCQRAVAPAIPESPGTHAHRRGCATIDSRDRRGETPVAGSSLMVITENQQGLP